ncbi:MAG: hypothetical protein ACRD0P_35395, partial [Stackebrandtia sp.]
MRADDAIPVPGSPNSKPTVIQASRRAGGRLRVFLAAGAVVALATASVAVPILDDTVDPTVIVAFTVMLLVAGVIIVLSRITSAANVPDHMAVSHERIELVLRRGTGRLWRREDGDRVRLRGNVRGYRAYFGADGIAMPWAQLRYFDVAVLRAACIAHAWSWQQGDQAALTPVPQAVAARFGDVSS